MILSLEDLWGRYPDGESFLQMELPSCIHDVVLYQPPSREGDWLMRVLGVASLLGRQGIRGLTWALPYLPYARQDRDKESPLFLLEQMLANFGIQRVVSCDRHSAQSSGRLDIISISPAPLFAPLLPLSRDGLVIVSPDQGGITRAQDWSHALKVPIIGLEKKRQADGLCKVSGRPDEIRGRRCLVVDDILDSGETLRATASWLQKAGATSIDAFVTHLLSRDEVWNRLRVSFEGRIFTTNSIPRSSLPSFIHVWDIETFFLDEVKSLLFPG